MVSQFGSAIGMVALPVIAVAVLDAAAWQVSLPAGNSALTTVLVAVLSAVGALAANTVGFLIAALAVRSIREPEPDPPQPSAPGEGLSQRSELFAGLGFVWGHPALRPILISWILFAGASSMAAPLTAVFYLRDLGFSALEYGLLMCGVGFGLVLVFAAAANSAMSGYRQLETPDGLMSRVATLWAFATTVSQPLFILLGGVVAALADARTALLVAAVVMSLAGLLLPRPGRSAIV